MQVLDPPEPAGEVGNTMTELMIGSGASPRCGAVRLVLVALVTIALLGVPAASFADEAEGRALVTGKESGLGAAAALSSLVYGPLKLAYATGGVLVGGVAWAFTAGDAEVADKVFTRALRGNYVITPDILKGQEPLYFIGRDDDTQPSLARAEAVASVSTTYAEPVTYSGTTTYSDSGTYSGTTTYSDPGTYSGTTTYTTVEPYSGTTTYSTSADSAVSGAIGAIQDSSTITTTETWERPAAYDDMGW